MLERITKIRALWAIISTQVFRKRLPQATPVFVRWVVEEARIYKGAKSTHLSSRSQWIRRCRNSVRTLQATLSCSNSVTKAKKERTMRRITQPIIQWLWLITNITLWTRQRTSMGLRKVPIRVIHRTNLNSISKTRESMQPFNMMSIHLTKVLSKVGDKRKQVQSPSKIRI